MKNTLIKVIIGITGLGWVMSAFADDSVQYNGGLIKFTSGSIIVFHIDSGSTSNVYSGDTPECLNNFYMGGDGVSCTIAAGQIADGTKIKVYSTTAISGASTSTSPKTFTYNYTTEPCYVTTSYSFQILGNPAGILTFNISGTTADGTKCLT